MKNLKGNTTMIGSVVVILIAAACSKEELSFDTVETSRKQANENSEYNAKSFRLKMPQYASFAIQTRGDSTQSNKCGQGDGWASIDLYNIDTNSKVPLKCSTVSAAIGCMTSEDFKSRPYANEDGRCNDSIPFPLPKIQK